MSEDESPVCIMPFVHIGCKPDGRVRLCCRAPQLEVREEDGTPVHFGGGTQIENVWNGSYYREIRQRLARGEKLPECQNCWRDEAAGKKSKRMNENEKWRKEWFRIEDVVQNDGRALPPCYFDLRLGNQCNLRCKTCHPLYSSSWYQALNSNSKWRENALISDYFLDSQKRAAEIRSRSRDGGAFDESFWRDLKTVQPEMREIYISGGEPVLVRPLWDFLRQCHKEDVASKIKIRMNSNMTTWPDEFIALLRPFKRVYIGASVDAVGRRNDWIRYPSRFEQIEKSLAKLKGENFVVEINCSVSFYNALYLDELSNWSKQSDLNLILDFVHDPHYLRPSLLPDRLKTKAVERLAAVGGPSEMLRHALATPVDPQAWRALCEHTQTWDEDRQFTTLFPELDEALTSPFP